MPDLLLSLLLLAAAFATGLMVHRIRSDQFPKMATLAITVLCVAGLLAMILTDWPLGILSQFWAEHSVLAGVLSSVLLVFLVFLVYERGEQQRQSKLSSELSGAGLGGIVDAIIDLEVALSLLSVPVPPDEYLPEHWGNWDGPGKPLRWIRNGRGILSSAGDPRRRGVSTEHAVVPWGHQLIDQSIRRLLAAMRDWTPLIGASADGTAILLILSGIRRDLMYLKDQYVLDASSAAESRGRDMAGRIEMLRLQLRVLALCFETWSGAEQQRPEILTRIGALKPTGLPFDDLSRSLSFRINTSWQELNMTTE